MLQLEPENRVTTVEISNHPWINKEIKIMYKYMILDYKKKMINKLLFKIS